MMEVAPRLQRSLVAVKSGDTGMKAFARNVGLIGVLSLALASAACQTPEPEAPPPPPPPPLPAVALNGSVAEAAAIYLAYMNDTAAIGSAFEDGSAVRGSLLRASAYEPVQLSRGMVAYAAVVALQSPEFVNGVRGLAADPAARDQILRQLVADPAYAVQLPGAPQAAGLIAAQIQGHGQSMFSAGSAVKQTAYDIQRQRWSSQHVTDRESRLEQVRVLGVTPLNPDYSRSATLQQAAQSGQGLQLPAAEATPPYTQAVVRGLALAAIAALGQAGDENRNITDSLLNEPVSADCLSFTRLMILQCLAASRPHYEEIFCLGQHLMMDTAQCVIDSAGPVTMMQPPAAPLLTADQPALEPAGDVAVAASAEAQTPN